MVEQVKFANDTIYIATRALLAISERCEPPVPHGFPRFTGDTLVEMRGLLNSINTRLLQFQADYFGYEEGVDESGLRRSAAHFLGEIKDVMTRAPFLTQGHAKRPYQERLCLAQLEQTLGEIAQTPRKPDAARAAPLATAEVA